MRLIDKDALKVELDAWARISQKPNHYAREEALYIIDTAPEIDAVPVVRGEWIDTYADDKEIGDFVKHCSICHNAIIKMLSASLNYCPACGAKMEDT